MISEKSGEEPGGYVSRKGRVIVEKMLDCL